jgi:DNA invertase Pin-like site-specific DNA recombinase
MREVLSMLECPHCGKQRQTAAAMRLHFATDHGGTYAPAPLPAPGGSIHRGDAGFGNRPVYRVYVRVSTDEQTNANQILKIKPLLGLKGVSDFVIYEDKESGANEDRPALNKMLLDLQKGDVVVITRADRLSRSLKHFVKVTEYIHDVGAEIMATEQPLDTTTPMGRAFWQVLGVFAELERALIIQRTLDGISRARKQGKFIGRHPVGCGSQFPCPFGIDHSPAATQARRAKRGRKLKGAFAQPPPFPQEGGAQNAV